MLVFAASWAACWQWRQGNGSRRRGWEERQEAWSQESGRSIEKKCGTKCQVYNVDILPVHDLTDVSKCIPRFEEKRKGKHSIPDPEMSRNVY